MEMEQSTDGFTKNQIDHALISARHQILKMWEAVEFLLHREYQITGGWGWEGKKKYMLRN
jgi:hypothetical protein